MTSTAIQNYDDFLSARGKRRGPSAIRALQPLMALPGMISLGGGLPNPSMFPFTMMNVTLADGSTISLAGQLLSDALQYSNSFGMPELLEWLKENLARTHGKAADDNSWSICVTTGSQDAIGKTLDTLLNDGDYIIIEDPTYPGTVSAMNGMGLKYVTIEVDENGMIPEKLDAALSAWDPSKPRPKVLYLIPTGQNPSGATLSNERREQIYKLAQKYNLIIMEDDPYWHLRLKPYKTAAPQEPLMSLFSMDTDGRVLRFESFSKIVSSGLRLGFVVGPTPLITKIQFAQQASTLHTAGLSQAMLIVLLQKIGPSGWDAHIANVQDFYTERRNKFLEYAEKHLTGLAEWWIPSAGMFVWFKFLGIDDSLQLIQEKAISAKVLMVPGRSCSVNDKPSPYARAAFSIASDAEMDEALRRLAEMLRAETKK